MKLDVLQHYMAATTQDASLLPALRAVSGELARQRFWRKAERMSVIKKLGDTEHGAPKTLARSEWSCI